MIYVGENKSILCKGDFRPAQLYKGDKKIAGYTVEEFEGEGGVTLEKCYNDNLHNAVIYGNSVQDGNPAPEEPVEVQSVGELITEGEHAGKYKVPVTVHGKNLLDLSRLAYHSQTEYGLTAEPYGKDGIRVYGTPAKANDTINLGIGNVGYGYDFSYKAGTVLRMSVSLHPAYNNITGNSAIGYFSCGKSGSNWSTYITTGKKELSHDIDRIDVATVYVTPKDTETYLDFVVRPQLELGDTATAYEPYVEPQTHNIYLDAPLRKIGEYADYIDFDKGVIVRNIRKQVFNGSEAWVRHNIAAGAMTVPTSMFSLDALQVWCLCNRLEAKTWSYLYGNRNLTDGNYRVGIARKSDYLIVCPYSTLPTLEEWKAQLQQWNEEGNPFTAWYVQTATEEAIELTNFPTFKSTTIYEINTSIPAEIKGNYKKQEVK